MTDKFSPKFPRFYFSISSSNIRKILRFNQISNYTFSMSIHTEHLWVVGIHPKNMCVFIVFVATLVRFTRAFKCICVRCSVCRVCARIRNWNRTLCESSSPKYNSFQWVICTVFCVVLVVECFVLLFFFFTSNQFLSILSNKNIEKWFPRLEWIREKKFACHNKSTVVFIETKKRRRNDNNSNS